MRDKLMNLLNFAVTFAAMVLMFLLARRLFDMPALAAAYPNDLHSVLMAFCLPGGMLLCRMLHGLGRMIFGLSSGYALVEWSVFGFGLHSAEKGHLALGFRRPVRRLCGMLLPPAWDGSSPWRLFMAGGVILSGGAGLLMMGMALMLRETPQAAFVFLACAGIVCFLLCILLPGPNCLPAWMGQLAGNVHLRRAQEHHMYANAANRRGQTIYAMPDDFFAPYPEELWSDARVFIAQVNVTSFLCRNGHYAEAYETYMKLAARLDDPACPFPRREVLRLFLTCDAAICEALCGAPPLESEKLYAPSIELFLGGEWFVQLQIARYLRMLLVLENEAMAESILVQIRERMAKLPEPLREGKERLIAAGQAIAASRKAKEAEDDA